MSQLLSATLGRLMPRYRSLSDWAGVYQQVLATRPISAKTLANRRTVLRHIVDTLGSRSIGSIRPHEIAQLTRQIHTEHPATARRVLIEARDMFAEAIAACRDYARPGEHLLRKSTGGPLVVASLSARFEDAREGALGMHSGTGAPPSLHECRSLSERLYRRQGIDTRTLLGHKHQAMTDVYNDDRGLTAGEWKTLEL